MRYLYFSSSFISENLYMNSCCYSCCTSISVHVTVCTISELLFKFLKGNIKANMYSTDKQNLSIGNCWLCAIYHLSSEVMLEQKLCTISVLYESFSRLYSTPTLCWSLADWWDELCRYSKKPVCTCNMLLTGLYHVSRRSSYWVHSAGKDQCLIHLTIS